MQWKVAPIIARCSGDRSSVDFQSSQPKLPFLRVWLIVTWRVREYKSAHLNIGWAHFSCRSHMHTKWNNYFNRKSNASEHPKNWMDRRRSSLQVLKYRRSRGALNPRLRFLRLILTTIIYSILFFVFESNFGTLDQGSTTLGGHWELIIADWWAEKHLSKVLIAEIDYLKIRDPTSGSRTLHICHKTHASVSRKVRNWHESRILLLQFRNFRV